MKNTCKIKRRKMDYNLKYFFLILISKYFFSKKNKTCLRISSKERNFANFLKKFLIDDTKVYQRVLDDTKVYQLVLNAFRIVK